MTLYEKLKIEMEESPDRDDWDDGYIAGLKKAMEIVRDEEWDKILEAVKNVYMENPND